MMRSNAAASRLMRMLLVGGLMLAAGPALAQAPAGSGAAAKSGPTKSAQIGPALPPEVVPGLPDKRNEVAEPPADRPMCDEVCMRRGADPAAQACVPLIEAKAAVDYDWLTRPFGGMFTQAEKPGRDGLVRYRGDSLRVLVQNQWMRHAYECAWDPVAGKVVGVQLRPGRLVPPAAIAQLTGQPLGPQGNTAQMQSPDQAREMIQAALQRAAQQMQAQQGQRPAPPPPPKRKRHWGEPSPVSIQQARLPGGAADTQTEIRQVPGTRR